MHFENLNYLFENGVCSMTRKARCRGVIAPLSPSHTTIQNILLKSSKQMI